MGFTLSFKVHHCKSFSGNGRLELIGFDACLMGNLEVAHAVAPYARPNARGISLFFPPHRKAWKESEDYGRIPFARDVAWASFIDDYVKKAKKPPRKKRR